jgi:hypothetical protein
MSHCSVCGGSLEGRDPRALTCSASCRREAARFRAVCRAKRWPLLDLAQLIRRRSRCVQTAVASRMLALLRQVGPRARNAGPVARKGQAFPCK